MPSGRGALLDTALLHERQGRLRDAKAAYERMLRRGPRGAGLPHHLGLIEARLGGLG